MDEAFWREVREAYPVQKPLLNLNNAAVSPPPLCVQERVIEALRFISHNPDRNMWSHLDAALPETKRLLADLADCAPEEVALNRNSTEALCTAIFGISLRPGDRVLVCEWDYPSMIAAWLQRAAREGVEVVTLQFDPTASDDEIFKAYSEALGDKVRVLHLTHMLHWNGRTLPVERLCRLARERDVVTVVDGAQTLAQIEVSFRRIGCDYFGASLHKWLGAPIGNGMLLVRRDQIERTFPLVGSFEQPAEGIAKFDHWNLGTYNSALQAGIPPALNLHQSIGTARIHCRLAHLTRTWVAQASDIAGFRIHTPIDDPGLAAISLFSIDGCDSRSVERELRERFRIHVKYRECGDLLGLRVSPHIYTSEDELERFVEALRSVAAQMREGSART